MIVLIAIALLGAILLSSQLVSRGFAQSTVILIQPSSSDVDVDDTITVDIRIEDVADLYGVDVRLSFEPTLLEVVQIQAGSFPAPDFVVKKEADNSAGTVWYAVSQMAPTEPTSGSGVAASITFKGLAGGTSSVAFTYQKIVKKNGEQIPATTQDGQITVVGTETSTPTYLPIVFK
jgi:general secretion pathway protein D